LVATLEELKKEITKMFEKSNETEDIGLMHDTIWPAVVKCETYFRKSQDIRALEEQVRLLNEMGDNIYRGQYLQDAYVVCRRILEMDPSKEAATHTIKNHIIPYFHRDYSYMKDMAKTDEEKKQVEQMIEEQKNIESKFDSYFIECKKDEFVLFSDDNANSFNSQGNNVGKI
jgi:hypothetical protein